MNGVNASGSCLLLVEIVRDDADPHVRPERRQQRERAVDGSPAFEVGAAIRGRRRVEHGLPGGHARGAEHAAEPLDAGVVDVPRARQHFPVQFFQIGGVQALELGKRSIAEARVLAVDDGQRGARGAQVIEQRVVEVEQHRPCRASGWTVHYMEQSA